MKLLAIDTATPASSVALADGRRIVATASRADRRGHSSFLVPAIDFCFDQADWRPGDIDAIVVDVGPGLYTGIRVGMATAQGLAAAIGIPLIPACSLDALALRAATGRRSIWAAVDVRRGELAVASYRPVPGGVIKQHPPEIVTPEGFRGLLESEPGDVLVVGDVDSYGPDLLTGMSRVRPGRPNYPAAEALIEIGTGIADRDEIPHPDEIRLIYLREPDVSINWDVLHPVNPWGDLP